MKKIDVFSLPHISNNPSRLKLANNFKNYCSIRRDLRTADEICNHAIALDQKIKDEPGTLNLVAGSLFLVRGALMHAIVLYGRWFKSTKGKPTLSPETFFMHGGGDSTVHDALISLRDRYVAHNELDTLGADRVWANFSLGGEFVDTNSDWIEQQFIRLEGLSMQSFQKCIHIVHNKIDAEILPEIQRKLDCELLQIKL